MARGPLTVSDVTDFIAPRVAHYKRIRHVEFIDSIPKSPSRKIPRRVLVERERASQRSAPAAAHDDASHLPARRATAVDPTIALARE